VTTLKADPGPDARGEGAGEPAAPGAGSRWRGAAHWFAALVRRHWIFSIALVAGAALRLIVMLGFTPAVLFRLDTFDYVWGALHVSPNVVNPSGYSLFLWFFRPFHSFVLIVAVQHLMGLLLAGLVYAMVRHFGLPRWAGTLAAVPVLFDPAQLLIEQFVMADLLAMLMMMGSFAVLLLGPRKPSFWRVVISGVLIGASVTVRPTTIPIVFLIPLFLLVRRAGWQRAGAALAAGVIPVLAYMSWFDAVHGEFNLTSSNGLFLWSRTMSFANCQIIKPSADLRALCPEEQPGPLSQVNPDLRRLPKRYLWNHSIWAWQGADPTAFVPDTAAFTQANNARAQRFAILAIKAQPGAYLHDVVTESLRPFRKTNILRFPTYQPHTVALNEQTRNYALGVIEAWTGNTQGVANNLGVQYGVRLHTPFSSLVQKYQRVVYLPGPVFALIVLVGLGGLLWPRRRTAAAALLWVSAMIIMVLPTAEHEYTYRYVIPIVPLVCIAAAIALRRLPARTPAAGPAGGLPVSTAPAGGTTSSDSGAPAGSGAPADGDATADGTGAEAGASVGSVTPGANGSASPDGSHSPNGETAAKGSAASPNGSGAVPEPPGGERSAQETGLAGASGTAEPDGAKPDAATTDH
jgi:hypothetical protein